MAKAIHAQEVDIAIIIYVNWYGQLSFNGGIEAYDAEAETGVYSVREHAQDGCDTRKSG